MVALRLERVAIFLVESDSLTDIERETNENSKIFVLCSFMFGAFELLALSIHY